MRSMNGSILKQVCIGQWWRGTIVQLHDPRVEKPYVLFLEKPVGDMQSEQAFEFQIEATAHLTGVVQDEVNDLLEANILSKEAADGMLKELKERYLSAKLN